MLFSAGKFNIQLEITAPNSSDESESFGMVTFGCYFEPMLTQLQEKKLTHYFRLLDFDNNGTIEKEDFMAIAENLCVLWGVKEGSHSHEKYLGLFEKSWNDFRDSVDNKDPDHATLQEWLNFCDKYLVNGSEHFFDEYVLKTAEVIFDTFDANHDGYISLDEYIDFFMAYHIQVRYSAKSYTKLDLNSDDLLSKYELMSALEEFFKSDDENAPGNWMYGFWGHKEI